MNLFDNNDNYKNLTLKIFFIPVFLATLQTSIAYGDGVHNYYKAILSLIVFMSFVAISSILIKNYPRKKSSIKKRAITIEREALRSLSILTSTCMISALLYYFQTNEMHSAVVLSGASPGLFCICLNTLYKLKYLEQQSHFENPTSNNRALKKYYQLQYVFCILAASLIPVIIYCIINDHITILLCSSISLLSVNLIHRTLTKPSADSYEYSFSATYFLFGSYIALFSIGWII